MSWTRKSSPGTPSRRGDQHKFEHWYRDNQVYFLTARVRGRMHAFASEQAKQAFWRQFDAYLEQYSFTPWITSLLDNHYHTMGYLRWGEDLPKLMQGLHGSVAKLVNDVLEEQGRMHHEAVGLKPHSLGGPGDLNPRAPLGRIARPFWGDSTHKNYMDGCLRDPLQGARTYRYIYRQPVRHGIVADARDYAHTRIHVEMGRAIARADQLNAFLRGVRYRRYEGPGRV